METNGRFSLAQGFPLCLWDQNFIKKMELKGQLSSICQLLHRSGLIFDAELNVIPCNIMHQIKLGKLGKDFNNSQELLKFFNKNKILKIYDKLCSIPHKDFKM